MVNTIWFQFDLIRFLCVYQEWHSKFDRRRRTSYDTLEEIDFRILSNSMEYNHTDNLPVVLESNGNPFGSKNKMIIISVIRIHSILKDMKINSSKCIIFGLVIIVPGNWEGYMECSCYSWQQDKNDKEDREYIEAKFGRMIRGR